MYFESQESLFGVDAKLSSDGKSIEGGFQSAFLLAVPVPLRLQRISDPVIKEACASTAFSKNLKGTWQGDLKFGASWDRGDRRAGSSITVRVTLAHGPGGVAADTLMKPDTSEQELHLSAIQQSHGSLSFEVRGAGAAFQAELKGDELAGEWTQFDLDPVPLKRHRIAAK